MEQLALQMPSWYDATTLTERVAALRNRPITRESVNGNRDLAEHRLKCWRSFTNFHENLAALAGGTH
jgi:hypothetical protein